MAKYVRHLIKYWGYEVNYIMLAAHRKKMGLNFIIQQLKFAMVFL